MQSVHSILLVRALIVRCLLTPPVVSRIYVLLDYCSFTFRCCVTFALIQGQRQART